MALIANKVSKVNVWTGDKIITYQVGKNCDKINISYHGKNIYKVGIFQKTATPFGLMPMEIYDKVWAVWR